MNLYLSNEKYVFNHRITIQWTFTFQTKNVLYHRITLQWTFTFQTKKMSSNIELPSNEPLPFKQKNVFNHRIPIKMSLYLSNKKNVFNHRITIQWTFTFQTKKMSSTIELPYNEPLLLN